MSEIEQRLMIEEMKRTKYVGNHPELFLTREELTEIVNWLSDPANNE